MRLPGRLGLGAVSYEVRGLFLVFGLEVEGLGGGHLLVGPDLVAVLDEPAAALAGPLGADEVEAVVVGEA